MDKIDTLFKNPCFGKASIGRNLKKHLELTSDVLLQNLSTQFDGPNNSPVESKPASSDEELLLDDNLFMRHPRYFTEERESSRIPITGTTCMSLSIKEKFTTEKHSIRISEESVYDNKTSLKSVKSPKSNNHAADIRKTDDTNKLTENTTDTDIMDTKLNGTLVKMSLVLQEISSIIYNGIQPIESDGDNNRRQKRVTEFFSRFTRNYLYQLVRQLSDVRKLLGRPMSTSTQTSSASSLLVQDKLTTVCHTVVQALQSYSHHVPLTVISSAHSKCLTLVVYIREMCKLLRKLLAAHPNTISCVHNVEQHTQTLVDAINLCLLVSTDDTGRGTKVSLATVSNKSTSTAVRANVPFHKRQSLDKRLAMYNTSCVGWKRSATMLAKQRFNVQSRYKLGTYKPPMHSEARTCLTTTGPSQLTSTSKKSLGERRVLHSPVNSRVDEDIPTMVELELQKERQQRKERKHKHKTRVHTSASSEDDRVQPPVPVPVPPAAKPVHVVRKKQEDNFKTILQYLLVQLQQQEQQSSKEISSAAPAAVTAEAAVMDVGTVERSVMSTDNTTTTANASGGSVFDKIRGLVAHVRGITDVPASSPQSSVLDDKGRGNTQAEDNVQQSKTRIVALHGAPNAKLICIKDKSCFETDNAETDGAEQCSNDNNETTQHSPCLNNDQLQADRNVVTQSSVEHQGEMGEPDVEEQIKQLNWTDAKQIPDAIVDDIIKEVYADMDLDRLLRQLFTSEFIEIN